MTCDNFIRLFVACATERIGLSFDFEKAELFVLVPLLAVSFLMSSFVSFLFLFEPSGKELLAIPLNSLLNPLVGCVSLTPESSTVPFAIILVWLVLSGNKLTTPAAH